MIEINKEITRLVDYAINKGLTRERDRIFVINRILEVLGEDGYEDRADDHERIGEVEDILERFRQWAVQNGRVDNDSIDVLDLFDTKLMGALLKTPSEFELEFQSHYLNSPEEATEFYYDYSINSNYIREKRVAKDIRWNYETEYGAIDMTINLSKPEKDPRAIAQMKFMKDSYYPKCMICKENEGYAGRLNHPARQNLRTISIELADEPWFLQYSPYVYYNEHCIVFKGEHSPMRVTEKTFRRLLEFNGLFPHYVIGSNADLPIVGGSILTHDHFQGGNYEFAMARAEERNPTEFRESKITACTLHWPMSVIRLKGGNVEELVKASGTVLDRWRQYSDESVGIASHTNGEGHNTITPITRFRDGLYEVDLILRNNRTDEEHPFGIFHSRERFHHIKRENIGLIEAMGLAVLPSRLKKEMGQVKEFILKGDVEGIFRDDELEKHGHFAMQIMEGYEVTRENIDSIIDQEIGKVFLNVLKDAGVFKDTEEGKAAFANCCEVLYEGL